MDRYEALDRLLKERAPELRVEARVPMSGHTSFRIGGPAARMAFPTSEGEFALLLSAARDCRIPVRVLGNGSNLLVSDVGVDALVIKTEGLKELERVGEDRLLVGAGVLLSRLASYAQGCGLSGLEFAHGIPGSLGGAVLMNAGAYDGEMKDVVLQSRALTADGQIVEFSGEEQGFSYRHSCYSAGGFYVVSALLQLKVGDPASIRERMDELAQKRREKQPLEYPSAGSTFKRPEGHFAAALIDQAGLKGLQVGGAQVSEKHAGFVVNRGGASCRDVQKLMEQIRVRVREHSGVTLEQEIRFWDTEAE